MAPNAPSSRTRPRKGQTSGRTDIHWHSSATVEPYILDVGKCGLHITIRNTATPLCEATSYGMTPTPDLSTHRLHQRRWRLQGKHSAQVGLRHHCCARRTLRAIAGGLQEGGTGLAFLCG